YILAECPVYERHRKILRDVSPSLSVPEFLGTKAGIHATAQFIRRSGAFGRPTTEVEDDAECARPRCQMSRPPQPIPPPSGPRRRADSLRVEGGRPFSRFYALCSLMLYDGLYVSIANPSHTR
ncbi:hypothetical protein AURDEDRAFT_72831, partial [Auricularia subglabra TFB-10046 SS5]